MRTRVAFLVVAVLVAACTLISNLKAQPLVGIETVTVGDPGNAADTTGYGRVTNVFAIGKYEVTISQYTAFLNSVARTNTNSYIVSLWNPAMETHANIAGISRSGSGTLADPYSYSVIGPSGLTPAGASSPGARPITYVSWFDAARFANWMNNGATNGASTETGAYSLNGATNGGRFLKNAGATWWIPSENEWYKAAFYKGGGTNTGYWVYPTQSDDAPGNIIGGATNQANIFVNRTICVTQVEQFSASQNYLTDVGAFHNSASAYGTYDQAGNVYEWTGYVADTVDNTRMVRGAAWNGPMMGSERRVEVSVESEIANLGIRLASQASDASVLPEIVSTSHSSGGFSMTWTPASNVNVQRCLDLNGAAWTTVSSNVTGTSYSDQATPAGRAFYRLALP